MSWIRLTSTAAAIAVSVSTLACTGRVSQANARLRAKVRSLQSEIQALQGTLAEREMAIRTIALNEGRPPPSPHAPRLAGIEIGTLVTIEDSGGIPILRFHLEPFDGLRRFLQITGEISIDVVSAGGESEPTIVGHRIIKPGPLRDSWRRGLIGSYYALDVRLDASEVRYDTPLLVTVTLTCESTGTVLEAHRLIEDPLRLRRLPTLETP